MREYLPKGRQHVCGVSHSVQLSSSPPATRASSRIEAQSMHHWSAFVTSCSKSATHLVFRLHESTGCTWQYPEKEGQTTKGLLFLVSSAASSQQHASLGQIQFKICRKDKKTTKAENRVWDFRQQHLRSESRSETRAFAILYCTARHVHVTCKFCTK